MPEQRDIVVDVKTPLEAYLAQSKPRTTRSAAAQLRRHAQIVGARIRELSSTAILVAVSSAAPDFVVLFLPGDQFLSAALQESPGLIDDSLRQKRHARDAAHQPRRTVEGSLVRLEADRARRQRGRDPPPGRGCVHSDWRCLANIWDVWEVPGQQRGFPSTKQSARSSNRCLPAARRFPELGLRVNREIDPIEPVASLTRIVRATPTPARTQARARAQAQAQARARARSTLADNRRRFRP